MIFVGQKNIKYINPHNANLAETKFQDFLKTRVILGIVPVV